jgi:YVTN family beta-propeller protein
MSSTSKKTLAIALATSAASLLGWAFYTGQKSPQLAQVPSKTPLATTAPQKALEISVNTPAVSASAASEPIAQTTVTPPNIYQAVQNHRLNPLLKEDLERVYVPNLRSNDVYVIDPTTLKVIDRFKVGISPQHIVPSWDLRTLWVTNNAEGRTDGSLTPIDPRTGKPGASVPVDDPYNMYYTPDGQSAIVVAEARKRLDFRDPVTMALQFSIDTPGCPGINHADFSIDGRFAIFTCEFSGTLAKIDLVGRKVSSYLQLDMPATRFKETSAPRAVAGGVWEPGETELCSVKRGMPQDIRSSPDGKRFYVADMHADGVHIIDTDSFTKVGFLTTGIGAHGLYPSRDGKSLYVVNRGSHQIRGPKKANGGVTVMDFASEKIVQRWPVPGGGSPDMGNVSLDGQWLWLAARYDHVVYRFNTHNGAVDSIKVGTEPHGLTVWPQPGRYSLGHTGNMR